jgi:hypothetical protein
MAVSNQRRDEQAVAEIAIEMGEAELRRDEATLRSILDQDLRFRRANGLIVDKDEFLKDLRDPRNT